MKLYLSNGMQLTLLSKFVPSCTNFLVHISRKIALLFCFLFPQESGAKFKTPLVVTVFVRHVFSLFINENNLPSRIQTFLKKLFEQDDKSYFIHSTFEKMDFGKALKRSGRVVLEKLIFWSGETLTNQIS